MFHDIVDNNADKVTIIKMAGDSIIIITTMLINNGYDMADKGSWGLIVVNNG